VEIQGGKCFFVIKGKEIVFDDYTGFIYMNSSSMWVFWPKAVGSRKATFGANPTGSPTHKLWES